MDLQKKVRATGGSRARLQVRLCSGGILTPPCALKRSHLHTGDVITRLEDFTYKGCYRYFITLRCHRQAGHFANGNFVSEAVQTLEKTAKQKEFYVWAYCFMPDHLHILVEGKTEDADMRKFISVFKQGTALCFNRSYGVRLWQPGYYDRVLRKDEATTAISRYIFENPVRKGIATDYLRFPYSGSLEFSNISQLFV